MAGRFIDGVIKLVVMSWYNQGNLLYISLGGAITTIPTDVIHR
jgi:hypothetical protein